MERALSQNSSKDDYMLYVANLPAELNENGVRELFGYYGKVVSLFFRPGTTWGYVTFGTYKDAENAIRDLHDEPPLYLKVSFAKKKRTDNVQVTKTPVTENNSTNSEGSNRPSPAHSGKSSVPVTSREERLQAIQKAVSSFVDQDYTAEDDLLYPYPVDPCTFNPYENTKPYGSTSTLWTRGQLTVTQDGKRHVSLGRGYTMYQIPEPHPDVENQITKVYEKRHSGLYEYGKDKLRCKIGKCQTCSKVTKFTCERCYGFYCSKDCQISDWPRHKSECQAIPALIGSVNSMSVSESNNEEQAQNRFMSTMQTPLRRPKSNNTSTPNGANENSGPTSKATTGVTTPAVNENASTDATKTMTTKVKDQSKFSAKYQTKNLERTNAIPEQKNLREKTDTGVALKLNQDESCAYNAKKITEAKHVDSTAGSVLCTGKSSELLAKITKPSDNKLNAADCKSNENIPTRRTNFRPDDVPKIEKDIAFQQYVQLSKEEFTPVKIIVPCGNREYWIQRKADETALVNMMLKLHTEAESSKKVDPVINNIYAVMCEGIWHRALVTSLKPLKVHYIDYGNDEDINIADFREIGQFKSIARYSEKIRLSVKATKKHSSLDYEDELSVKMISIDSDKVINVEVEHENEETTPSSSVTKTDNFKALEEGRRSESNKSMSPTSENETVTKPIVKLPSVVNTIACGEKGILEVHAKLNDKSYGITLLPSLLLPDFEMLLSNLPSTCMTESENSDYKPSVGDLVCGQRLDDDWLRGYIVSTKPSLRMAIVDEARVMSISKSIPCPKEFTNICTFGAVCSITEGAHSFKSSDQFTFEVTSLENLKEKNEVEIKFLANGTNLKATVTPWSPLPEQAGVQHTELKNGSEVCITAYRNQKLVYARPLDTAAVEHYNSVMQKVAKCALSAQPLKSPPVVGEMVMARYVDNNFYRAIVSSVKDDNVAISFVDFGNVEVPRWDKLLSLSDDLKQVRSCCARITLKDVINNIPITKEASNYLSYLMGKEIPLVYTFIGDPSKDGVCLKLPTGESVNEKLNELLTPNWKAEEEDKRCYMIQDLEVAKLGKLGETVSAFVSFCMEEGSQYALCPPDHDLMTHVYEIMPTLMKIYCNGSEFYVPRENELCLGLYKEDWCRAICLGRHSKIDKCSLFFVDFGNLEDVDNKNIRYMPKDFITPSALISVCTIVNLTPDDSQLSSKVRERISEFIVPNQLISVKIVSESDDGVYNIEIPHVQTKLRQEGLL